MNPYLKTLLVIIICIEVFSVLPKHQKATLTSSFPHLNGVIHVHSTFSDGGGTPTDIMEAAQKTDMDFVILTDHNNTQARKDFERSYGKSDLFVEMEASTPAGHMISFSSLGEAAKLADQDVVDLSYKQFRGLDSKAGFFSAVAHPSNIKNPWNQLDRYPDGMELINFDSLWQRAVDNSVLGFLLTTAVYPLNPYLTGLRLFSVYPKDLAAWDGMTGVPGRKYAVLGHDTHAKLKLNDQWSWRWPDYEETFRLASNIIYLKQNRPDDFIERKKAIYAAIRAGRVAIVFQSIAPFEGNDFRIECSGQVSRPGDDAKIGSGSCQGVIDLSPTRPYPTTLRIIKDGNLLEEIHDAPPNYPFVISTPGVYRVEVYVEPKSLLHFVLRRPVPYLFYNPIYVS